MSDLSTVNIQEDRAAVTFHRTFALNRPGVTAILSNSDDGTKRADYRESTQLGTIYIEAMPHYARACGLMEFGSTKLTPLGEFVLAHDASLSLPATQWLMHYHLSAPQGPGPRFWHDLILRLPELGSTFGSAELTAEVRQSVEAEQGRALVDRSLRTCASVFAGSYTKADGLGALGILRENDGGGYRSGEPEMVPPGVLAYALAHYWASQFGQAQTRNLSDLSEPGGFGSLFFMGQFALNRALRGLAGQGVLELWMQAPPHQVTRPPTPEKLLEGIYAD